MLEKKMNHCAKVLNHLMRHGRITRKDAEKQGIGDLKQVIWLLRNIEIKTKDGYYEIKRPTFKPKVRVPFEDDLFPNYENEL